MPFILPINMNSAMLVRDELMKSLATAQNYVDAYVGEPGQPQLLDGAIVELHQVNGILRVVEFGGAIELSGLLLQLSQGIVEGKIVSCDAITRLLVQGVSGLGQFIDTSIKHQQISPLAINDLLNQLRARLRQPIALEAALVGFAPTRDPQLCSAEPFSLTVEQLPRVKRLVHMYQVGLVAVLRDKNLPANLHLMERAITRLRHGFASMADEEWWLLVSGIVQQMRAGALRTTYTRKRMLGLVDGYLRKGCLVGQRPALALEAAHRDGFLCLLAMTRKDSALAGALCRQYGLPEATFSDAQLAAQELALLESSEQALNVVAQAVREQLQQIKELLELHRDAMTVEAAGKVATQLQAIGETLGQAGFNRLKGVLVDTAFTFNQSMAAGVTDRAAMQGLAEALLMVENTLRDPDCFNDHAMSGQMQGTDMLARSMLDEATGVVINESKAAIALAKRGISAYLDSNFDAVHVANVGASLGMVRGVFQILGHERAAKVLQRCINFIDHFGVHSAEEQSRQSVETLADALISLEYYLDEMSISEQENRDLLAIAEESVNELGVAA